MSRRNVFFDSAFSGHSQRSHIYLEVLDIRLFDAANLLCCDLTNYYTVLCLFIVSSAQKNLFIKDIALESLLGPKGPSFVIFFLREDFAALPTSITERCKIIHNTFKKLLLSMGKIEIIHQKFDQFEKNTMRIVQFCSMFKQVSWLQRILSNGAFAMLQLAPAQRSAQWTTTKPVNWCFRWSVENVLP